MPGKVSADPEAAFQESVKGTDQGGIREAS